MHSKLGQRGLCLVRALEQGEDVSLGHRGSRPSTDRAPERERQLLGALARRMWDEETRAIKRLAGYGLCAPHVRLQQRRYLWNQVLRSGKFRFDRGQRTGPPLSRTLGR